MKRLFLITLNPGANLWTNINARFFAVLLVLAICGPGSPARAQYCNPALVSYFVRDENGKPLTEEALKFVAEQLPKSIRDARIYIGQASLPDLTPDQPQAPKQLITEGRLIFKPILPQLQKSTRVPLRLPTYLAAEDETNQLYAVIDAATPTSYELQVAFSPDCEGGTACRYGIVTGHALGAKSKRPRGRPVSLARGLTGYFVDATCGANCSYSTLSWLQDGYRYTVGIYEAEIQTLRKVANSAINNGVFNQ